MSAVKIILCALAVYGAYSIFIEICAFLCRKARVVYSVRAASDAFERDLSAAYTRALYGHGGECSPAVLCENGVEVERVRECGADVYIRVR